MTIDQFEKYLDDDLSWRKFEVSELFTLSKSEKKEVLLKSLILLIYSHWEGYIKKSSKLYIKYIAEKKVRLNHLSQNFTAIKLKSQIGNCLANSDNLTLQNELTFINTYNKKKDKIFDISLDPDNDLNKDIIDTDSNLKPKILRSIIEILGLLYKDAVKTREHYISSKMLQSRNLISHGSKFHSGLIQDFDLDIRDIEKLKNFVFVILDSFKEELMEFVEKEYYLERNENQRMVFNTEHENRLEMELKKIIKSE